MVAHKSSGPYTATFKKSTKARNNYVHKEIEKIMRQEGPRVVRPARLKKDELKAKWEEQDRLIRTDPAYAQLAGDYEEQDETYEEAGQAPNGDEQSSAAPMAASKPKTAVKAKRGAERGDDSADEEVDEDEDEDDTEFRYELPDKIPTVDLMRKKLREQTGWGVIHTGRARAEHLWPVYSHLLQKHGPDGPPKTPKLNYALNDPKALKPRLSKQSAKMEQALELSLKRKASHQTNQAANKRHKPPEDTAKKVHGEVQDVETDEEVDVDGEMETDEETSEDESDEESVSETAPKPSMSYTNNMDAVMRAGNNGPRPDPGPGLYRDPKVAEAALILHQTRSFAYRPPIEDHHLYRRNNMNVAGRRVWDEQAREIERLKAEEEGVNLPVRVKKKAPTMPLKKLRKGAFKKKNPLIEDIDELRVEHPPEKPSSQRIRYTWQLLCDELEAAQKARNDEQKLLDD
ncbi:hypothetical protein EK21DRAFT_112749 [Setomelanomma holmii]|uniref:Uncharacterized protein n=1 Tax=Setomelanomma holmii TaxID=210430 RepID=A0A9P4H7H7_9PLEO|nr:hypothetical protein EK21DRAFT_112749 [Setomelanomma holmii]